MNIHSQIDKLYKSWSGKMIASLASYFGFKNLAVAEDIVQETFAVAIEQWVQKGLPDNPAAWLFKVCKHKALNNLKRKENYNGSLDAIADEVEDLRLNNFFLDHEIKDNQLRLLFACCHSSLAPRSQVIIILKYLGGLKVEAIARAFGLSDEAVMKTISRGRHTLEEDDTLNVPLMYNAGRRLNSVLTAIYLLFNEGYNTTEGDAQIKKELCLEAMKLARSLLNIPDFSTPDSFALMALMCFHTARFDTREDASKNIIELENQDRTKWDVELIKLGTQYFNKTVNASPSRFIIEAAIASQHCIAKTFRDTDWKTISRLYQNLQAFNPSPFTDLNTAISRYYDEGQDAALKVLSDSRHSNYLQNYYLYHAFLGKMFAASKAYKLSIEHYKKAISLTKQKAAQDLLSVKMAEMKL